MKKILIAAMCGIFLTGCAQVNEAKDDMSTYTKEETKCIEGHKIWIYRIGKNGSSSITSQIIGECKADK